MELAPVPTNNMDRETLTAREAKVLRALEFLVQLRLVIELGASTDNASHWLKPIDDLNFRGRNSSTIIGVVGNTGAGKSSVINAVLDEKTLLPTSCWRACTAAPTQISYNYSDDPAEKYRAEVEFLSVEEWTAELRLLYGDMGDSSEESEVGPTKDMLVAVYPHLSKSTVGNASIEELMSFTEVTDVLGTTKVLRDTTGRGLNTQIRRYLVSQDANKRSQKHKSPEVEYWPLVKVVRIYTKAHALSSGTVLVDLPGVQDSNAGRAAVAEKYRKNCTGMWIVAPICRAVDDATVKKLLDNSLKRQLQMDGLYSGALTFVCSKADDINIQEAQDSFEFEEKSQNILNRHEKLSHDLDELERRYKQAEGRGNTLETAMKTCNRQIKEYEKLAEREARGEVVYTPGSAQNSRKRKNEQPHFFAGKGPFTRARAAMNSMDEEDDDGEHRPESETNDNDEDELAQQHQGPLTAQDIDDTINKLTEKMNQHQEDKEAAEDEMNAINAEAAKVMPEFNELAAQVGGLCIRARNEHCRKAIRGEYARGLKNLDDEAAMDKNPDTHDPSLSLRNYEALSKALPVFCVSSKAYMELSSGKENSKTPIQDIDDTEIRQLQNYAFRLTEEGRENRANAFLNSFEVFVNSLNMWLSTSRTQLDMVKRVKREEVINKAVDALQKCFETIANDFHKRTMETMNRTIGNFLKSARMQATTVAPITSREWGRKPSEGGLPWNTYRAIVRRGGIFKKKDFNSELVLPITENLPAIWNKIFKDKSSNLLRPTNARLQKVLRDFHDLTIRESVPSRITASADECEVLDFLDKQFNTRLKNLDLVSKDVMELMDSEQKECSRAFIEGVKNEMSPIYKEISEFSGPGSHRRMVDAMEDATTHKSHKIFKQVTDRSKGLLHEMCNKAKRVMESRLGRIYHDIAYDYRNCLLGDKTTAGDNLRAEISELMKKFDIENLVASCATKEPAIAPMQVPPVPTEITPAQQPPALLVAHEQLPIQMMAHQQIPTQMVAHEQLPLQMMAQDHAQLNLPGIKLKDNDPVGVGFAPVMRAATGGIEHRGHFMGDDSAIYGPFRGHSL